MKQTTVGKTAVFSAPESVPGEVEWDVRLKGAARPKGVLYDRVSRFPFFEDGDYEITLSREGGQKVGTIPVRVNPAGVVLPTPPAPAPPKPPQGGGPPPDKGPPSKGGPPPGKGGPPPGKGKDKDKDKDKDKEPPTGPKPPPVQPPKSPPVVPKPPPVVQPPPPVVPEKPDSLTLTFSASPLEVGKEVTPILRATKDGKPVPAPPIDSLVSSNPSIAEVIK